MNKRIRELALQANGPNPFYGTLKNQMTLLGDDAVEKFAELIVRECLDISMEQKKWVEDMKPLNSTDEFWNQARIQQSQRIIDKIREHFGVEE